MLSVDGTSFMGQVSKCSISITLNVFEKCFVQGAITEDWTTLLLDDELDEFQQTDRYLATLFICQLFKFRNADSYAST